MSRAKRILITIALAAAALIGVLTVAAVIAVQTDWFRQFVRQKIITATENGTGGKVEIGSYVFDWKHLRSTVTHFVVHGEEPPGAPPYLQAERVQLDIRLFTSIHHLIDVASLVIDRPQANIIIFPDGHTNIPTPKTATASKQTPLETVVDLAIGRFALNDGRIVFASQEHALNIQGNNLRLNLAFNSLTRGYEGRLVFEPIYVVSGRNTPVRFAVTVPVSVLKNRITVRNATIATPRSSVLINGSLENLRDPTIAAHVNGRVAVSDVKAASNLPLEVDSASAPSALDLDVNAIISNQKIHVNALQLALGRSSVFASGTLKEPHGRAALTFDSNLALGELGRLTNIAARPDGVVTMKGTASIDGNNDYNVAGKIQAEHISFQQGSRRISGVNVVGAATMDPHVISLNDFRIAALGAEIRGNASLHDFARYQVRGNVNNLTLHEIAQVAGYQGAGYNGIVAGPIDVIGDVSTPGDRNLDVDARLSISPKGSNGIPVSGKLNVAYRGTADDLSLDNSYVTLPHTRLILRGSLKHQLQIALSSTDLNDVFIAAKGTPSPVTFDGGRVTFTATVIGGLSSPEISGHLAAVRFRVLGRGFDRLDTDAFLSRNHAAVRNGSVTRESMQAHFSAAVGLRDWKAPPDRPLAGDISIQNADLADAIAFAGRQSDQYSGMLTATAHVTGTVGNPRGSGNLQALNGTLQGQPFDRIQAQVSLTDRQIAITNASVETMAGRADLAAEFQHPRDSVATGQFHAHLQSSRIDLANVTPLQRERPNTTGIVQLNSDVTGTLSENRSATSNTARLLLTKITADGSVRGLHADGQNYGDLSANARTSGSAVSYNVTSDFAGSNLKLAGTTQLTHGYPSSVEAQLSGLPVERVLALVRRTDIRVKGNLSGTARLSGTLENPQGEMSVDLANAVLYDESVDHLRARAVYKPQDVEIQQLQIAAGSSHMDLTAHYAHPQGVWESGNFEIQVNDGRIDLARVKYLQSKLPASGGIVQISGNGRGQIQAGAPRFLVRDLNADIKANAISVKGVKFGDASLAANTSAGKLNFVLNSNLADASVRGQGNATLSGDYPIDARLSFTNLAWTRIRDLLGASGQGPSGFEAVADGQISARGPALKSNRMGGSLQLSRLQLNTVTSHPRSGGGISLQNQGPIVATLDRAVLHIQSAHVVGPQTDLQISGIVPLQSDGINVNVHGNANLALLRSLSPDVDSSGSVTLAATVSGAMTHPRIAGQIELRNGALTYADFGNGLANANGTIQFNGNAATVRNLTAESGGGKLTLSGFVALRDGVRLGLRANASKVRVRLQQGVSAVADGSVSLTGTLQSNLLSGNVSLDRVTYAPQTDLASILSQAPTVVETGAPSFLDHMKLDVRIKSLTSTTIQSSLADNLNFDADLQLRGTASHPGMVGRITCNEGQLVLFGSTYTVDSGTIGFFNTERIEPRLDLNLETEAKGVTVSLRVDGPLDNLKLSYSSDPPLQFQEIISLLATGATPTSDPTLLANQPAQPAQNFQQMGESALLGRAVADPVAGRLQRVFGVSQLKIDPSFTSGTDIPQATLSLQQRVASNIMFTYVTSVSDANAQTIRVDWTFNQKWSATVMRDENGIVSVNLVYKRQVR
jgi:translocation and assembly module TamB